MFIPIEVVILLSIILAIFAIAWPRLALFFRLWLLHPIRQHAKSKLEIDQKWEQTQLDQLTPEMRDFIGDGIAGFKQVGFAVTANLHKSGAVPGADVSIVVLNDDDTGDWAAVSITSHKHVRMLSFSVISEFADGFRIVTTNSRATGIIPANPQDHRVTFAWVTEPAVLIEAHRRRLQFDSRAAQVRVERPPGSEIEELNESWQRDLEWLVRRGYYYFDQRAGYYRHTIKGSFLTAWRVKEPIKRWLVNRRDRRSRELWNQLGMDQWEASRQISTPIAPAFTPGTVWSTSPREPAVEYQAMLAPGDVRRQLVNGVLTIRMGSPTVRMVLERGWMNIGFLFAVALVFGINLYRRWLVWQSIAWLPKPYRPPLISNVMLIWLLFLVGLFVYELWLLLHALSRVRGTTVVSADNQGLRVSNAPGRLRDAQFPRSRIEYLVVRLDQIGFGRPICRLEARITGERHKPILLISPSHKLLTELKEELLRALGIRSESPNSPIRFDGPVTVNPTDSGQL